MRLNKALLIKHVLVNKRIWKYSNGRNELCPPDIAHLRHKIIITPTDKILENKIFDLCYLLSLSPKRRILKPDSYQSSIMRQLQNLIPVIVQVSSFVQG
jgi:hypothetical protein